MFFLDNDRLAVQRRLTSLEGDKTPRAERGFEGIIKAPIVALRISTGEIEKPFKGDYCGTILPLDNGRKLLGIVSDDRNFFAGMRKLSSILRQPL